MELRKKWENFIQSLDKYGIGGSPVKDIVIKSIYFIVLIAIIPLLFSSSKSFKYTDMKEGSIATKKVVAPYNFYVLKTDEEIKEEREEVRQSVPYYFVPNDSLKSAQVRLLNDVVLYIEGQHPRMSTTDSTGNISRDSLLHVQNELKLKFDIDITTTNLNLLYDLLNNPRKTRELKKRLDDISGLIRSGILDRSLEKIVRPNVRLVNGTFEENLPPDRRVDVDLFMETVRENLMNAFNENQTDVILHLVDQVVTPNVIYSRNITDKAMDSALGNVALTKDMVYENERIVDANERINEEIYQRLYSLEMSKVERSRQEGNWQNTIAYLGKTLLLTAILFMVALYLFSFRRKLFNDNKKLLMISLIMMIQLILAAIISGPLDWPVYLIPTTIASMLLAILIDSGIAFVVTAAIALILGGVQGGGVDITLLTLISGMVSIYSVYEIRTRNQIFKAIIFIAVAYFLVILSLTAMRYDSFMDLFRVFTYNLLPNAIFSSFITFMILGVFERAFDVTTDVTLLELSDLNHPLLKRLSLEAPGTFHHSMVVGTLSEAAAKAIEANPLLARVGSYYHDIGKMEKPEYFVENQMDSDNRHGKLSPNMSALVLSSHVKNGIEMAKRFGIPKSIRDFIPEHHGTNIMKYFYHKAREHAGDKDDINESDFRYPGPKPQSKETAIVMLADAVEAATRTVQNPTPTRLRAFVEELVDQRFRDGELDECNLTFKDLKLIIDAFMPVLFGVFQHRIEYPDSEKSKAGTKTKSQKAEQESKNGN